MPKLPKFEALSGLRDVGQLQHKAFRFVPCHELCPSSLRSNCLNKGGLLRGGHLQEERINIVPR